MYDSNKTASKDCQNEKQCKINSTTQIDKQSINLCNQNKNNSGRVQSFTEFNKKYEKSFLETSSKKHKQNIQQNL